MPATAASASSASPGMSAPPVAEFTFALLLSLARKVGLADRLLREGHWPKPQLGGPLLRGKVLGIVGAGNIGGRVGEMGAAWGMRGPRLRRPTRATPSRTALAGRGIALADFDEVVRACRLPDACTCRSTRSTHHMIDAARPGADAAAAPSW